MSPFCLKLDHKSCKELIDNYLPYSNQPNNTFAFGLTTNHYGLLIRRKSMKNLEMTSTNGRHFLMKSGKTEELLITVKLINILDPSLLIIDWF
jgi:hypothetical protein